MNDTARARKLVKALVSHHSSAVRRVGDASNAYSVRSWWWDKGSTDALLQESEQLLPGLTDQPMIDQIRWQRASLYWALGRFEEAEADLLTLNRPDSVYVKEIGRSLGLIRKRKFMHEAI